MYGTVARIKVKSGQEKKLISVMGDEERARKIKGYVASYIYRSDNNPNELTLAVVFESKALYHANADDPEQDKWYRKMRECMQEDPAWNDGEIVYATK